MNCDQIVKNVSKVLPMICLCSFPLLIVLSGCALKNNKLFDYQISVKNQNYRQAAVRLERCSEFPIGRDSKECRNILERLKKSDLPLADAIKKDNEEKLKNRKKEEEKARISALRKSDDPWDRLSLALEIQEGTVEEAYPEEDKELIEKAFFGFGECSKQINPACMTQYAQMILYGIDALSEENKQSAREKALYWLNLSARYGNEDARRLLINLEETIPTPDLSMESLQKTANSVVLADMESRKAAERRQSYFNSQMLQESRRANFISSMRYFFPRKVNCTTTKIGAYTYTNCR
jgi:hypothetical protein